LADIDVKRQITAKILPWLNKLANPIDTDHYLKELSKRLNVSENSLKEVLQKMRVPKTKIAFGPKESVDIVIKINKQKIVFADGKFKNIPENLIEKWRQVAPGINVMTEIPKAELWVISNPQKGRSQWIRFLSNWMVRAQNNFIKYGGGDRNGREFRTNRTDPRDKTLQSREDIEIAAITAKWEAHKKAARDKTRRTAGNDDAPDFASEQITR